MAIAGISTNDRERFVVRADEKLTAFVELESALRAAAAEISRATKEVIERPLDVQQSICSNEQICGQHAFKMHWNDSLRRYWMLSPSLRQ
jgi:hypothetical protein